MTFPVHANASTTVLNVVGAIVSFVQVRFQSPRTPERTPNGPPTDVPTDTPPDPLPR